MELVDNNIIHKVRREILSPIDLGPPMRSPTLRTQYFIWGVGRIFLIELKLIWLYCRISTRLMCVLCKVKLQNKGYRILKCWGKPRVNIEIPLGGNILCT